MYLRSDYYPLFTWIGLLVIMVSIIAYIMLSAPEMIRNGPVDDFCKEQSIILENQILTNQDECLSYWTEQDYILQNNTLNGKYVLTR